MTLHLSYAWTMQPPAAPSLAGPGIANGGVIVRVLPHAEPRHLRDMAAELLAEAKRRDGHA